MFADLATAVIIGVILSALMFAWQKGRAIQANVLNDENGSKIYEINGPVFFGSAVKFKKLFDIYNDPDHVIVDFKYSKVMDHSAIEAINSITEKYCDLGKKIILRHLSKDCKILLKNAESIIQVNIEDPIYHVADDLL